MRVIGYVRKVDPLGRITIPKEIRDLKDINTGDALEIFVDKEKIILCKFERYDMFGNDSDDLIYYKGKYVSKKSIVELCSRAKINIKDKK
ncbi:MAG: AbrB/MazE/SpoVT family DNA-binding domain-containing protein [Lachnospiraceae bacterium]|nr:AbrB/MazE/SpoVT family DNA-binding domain-containing protein [Lachnospiraceae bacterium]